MAMFSNPLGLLALLGIPAILAIHFLQRRARRLPVSTWFLLDQVQRKSASGRRFERLKSSVPMWLQLACVLLIAWVLAAPNYTNPGGICRVAVVVDSSASMNAFLRESVDALKTEVSSLRGSAASLEVTLLESTPKRPRIYTGTSLPDALEALGHWLPANDAPDPTLVLRTAQSLVGQEGTVIWLTDTPGQFSLPEAVHLLAVGAPIGNVGFTGGSVFRDGANWRWRVLVKNQSAETQRRQWRMVSPSSTSPAQALDLAPGAVMTLEADWPGNASRVYLELTPDRFSLDDVMPMVLPVSKQLTAATPSDAPWVSLSEKLTRALDSVSLVPNGVEADFQWVACKPGQVPSDLKGNAVIWLAQPDGKASWLKGGFSAANHPWVDGLNWQALLVRDGNALEPSPHDQVLLWQDHAPRIWLHSHTSGGMQLVFNLDPLQSNLAHQPAFVVLLHRFCEALRNEKPAPQALNLDTSQAIQGVVIPKSSTSPVYRSTSVEGELLKPDCAGTSTHAPKVPGFFEIHHQDTKWLDSAVAFADAQEGDFSKCASSVSSPPKTASQQFAATRPDPLRAYWLLLALACLLGSWWVAGSNREKPPQALLDFPR